MSGTPCTVFLLTPKIAVIDEKEIWPLRADQIPKGCASAANLMTAQCSLDDFGDFYTVKIFIMKSRDIFSVYIGSRCH